MKCSLSGIFQTLLITGIALMAEGCGVNVISANWIGRSGLYDYSPSVIQIGNTRRVWWCGQAENPADHSQDTDAILYESINLTTQDVEGPHTVLAETGGAWDSAYTCNPRVIEGSFENPFGDGGSYQYAMYYVGTANMAGVGNSIGVAFSHDGVSWRKYPKPVIQTQYLNGYGNGQPVAYNTNQKSAITLFYEDSDPVVRHLGATSTDGIHFTVQGTVTTKGLDPTYPYATWGDMAYDPKTSSWYALFNCALRSASTTGEIPEWGQYGVELYRIPADKVLNPSASWQQLTMFDTNLTGYEANFIGGFVSDQYGNLDASSYPVLQMYLAESNPQPSWKASPRVAGESALPEAWDLHLEQWDPNNPPLSLTRYYNGRVHEVTTGWIDPTAGFHAESLLGHLEPGRQQGADLALYACKQGSSDYFVSPDSACEGMRILGREGYGFSHPVSGLNLVALYRCKGGDGDHFVSHDPGCEGQLTEEFLGYALQ
jgi:hypothetical protein